MRIRKYVIMFDFYLRFLSFDENESFFFGVDEREEPEMRAKYINFAIS